MPYNMAMTKDEAIKKSWLEFSNKLKKAAADYLNVIKDYNAKQTEKSIEEFRSKIKDLN